MTAATQAIQVKVEKGLTTTTIGGHKVEVGADGTVTVYSNDGVQTKPGTAGDAAAKCTHISISEDFNMIAVNGATIEQAADGHLVISTPGIVITKPAAANDTAAKAATLQVGHLDDGGVYVGLSAENGKPLHAALEDLSEYKTYEEALVAAEQLKSLHPTAHVPTPKELDKNLFDNKDAGQLKGTFNTSGEFPGGVYRSSGYYGYSLARVEYFDDGDLLAVSRGVYLPVRLVW